MNARRNKGITVSDSERLCRGVVEMTRTRIIQYRMWTSKRTLFASKDVEGDVDVDVDEESFTARKLD